MPFCVLTPFVFCRGQHQTAAESAGEHPENAGDFPHSEGEKLIIL